MNTSPLRPPQPFTEDPCKPSSTTSEFDNISSSSDSNPMSINPKAELEVSQHKFFFLLGAAVVLSLLWVVLSKNLPVSAIFAGFGGLPLGVCVALFLLVATLCYGVSRLNKNQIVLLVLALGMSIVPMINGAVVVRLVNAFILAFTCMLYLRSLIYPDLDSLRTPFVVLASIGTFFREQFAHSKDVRQQLFSRGVSGKEKTTGTSQTRSILLGVLIACAVLLVVFPGLQAANPVFSSFTLGFSRQFGWLFSGLGVWNFLRFLLIVPLAASLLWAVSFGSRHHAYQQQDAHFKGIAPVSALVLLGILDVVYLIWCASDLYYLLQVELARSMLSTEARTGFFQLMFVLLINLLLLWLCGLPHAGSAPTLQAKTSSQVQLLSAFKLLLIACTFSLLMSASCRLAAYIQAYGLTLARAYAGLALVFIVVVLTLCLVKLFRPQTTIFKPALIFALGFWCVFALARPAKLCADYNISRYLDGDLSEFSVADYELWGTDAASALTRLAASDDPLAADAGYELENILSYHNEIDYFITVFDITEKDTSAQ